MGTILLWDFKIRKKKAWDYTDKSDAINPWDDFLKGTTSFHLSESDQSNQIWGRKYIYISTLSDKRETW